ncbi:unnamed protein product [Penicillium glandicola]
MSGKNDTPLPTDLGTDPKFQPWHQFNPNSQQWDPVSANETTEPPHDDPSSDLVLLTWNIDAFTEWKDERITEILRFIFELDSKLDIIFLQEVSPRALQLILRDERIRTSFALGPVWRVAFPSHFGRDVLFCDLFVPSHADKTPTRVRFANVHLDSLAIKPSHRPRQLAIVSSFLRSAGRGLVAGDFNPVLEEDAVLVETNRLTDAWMAIRPEEPGYTWGADGKQRFPPNRMDKVALLGLKAREIDIFEPRRVWKSDGLQGTQNDTDTLESQQTQSTGIPSSDHHALLCSFELGE